jgi:peptide subunit release factor 1 (eRF1)
VIFASIGSIGGAIAKGPTVFEGMERRYQIGTGTRLAELWSMAKSPVGSASPLGQKLEALAAFEPVDSPVLSLYLNLTADQHGRDKYDTFVRKTFAERLKSFAQRSPARESFEHDTERIRTFLDNDVNRSANALAIFACSGADNFFEAIQLEAPLDAHWLFVGAVPHLYPLARLVDQYPRYAAVVLDTSSARIFVFGLSTVERTAEVTSEKTRRSSVGGWSQARYQRRADNMHLHHVKEVVDTLERIVASEQIDHLVVAGDEVAVPILRGQLSSNLSDKLIDVIRLDKGAPVPDVLSATLDVLKGNDATTDAERVEQLLSEWRSGGLGVAGPEATLHALQLGQVDELLITGTPATLKPVQRLPDGSAPAPVQIDTSAPEGTVDTERVKLSGELVTRAQQTSAAIRFIENADLLADIGGVGALLRFRI